MRLYICADIEGVAGVVSRPQLMPDGFEYEAARAWMTGEVNAAIEGARAAGITDIVISDSHGNGQNLLLDELPDDVEVVRSWPRPLGMMQGVEAEGTVGAFLIGQHTGHSDMDGTLAHTMMSSAIQEIRLNGAPASETRINAAIAGHFGVPILLATGDTAYREHVRSLLGEVETVAVKTSLTDLCGQTLMPAQARRSIRAAAERAIANRHDRMPYRISGPVTLDIIYKHRLPAQVLAMWPGVVRTAATAVQLMLKDITEVSGVLTVATSYDATAR